MNRTLYLVVVGGPDVFGNLDGVACVPDEVLWRHTSSNMDWLRRDLTTQWSDRRLELQNRFPNGYEVVELDGRVAMPSEVAALFARPVDGTVRERLLLG